MTATVFWFLVVLALFYFGAVVFAIYQGRNVKSSFKVPFAFLTFETEGTEKTGAKSSAKTLKRDATTIKPDQSETLS